jgi:predicted ArsR family transcriptional regulator
MDVPPLPAEDPLARDTRSRLFELLGQLGRPATTQELATEVDMHPNGVRRHLDQLQEAGLIKRHSLRQPRGRPKDGWSLDPDARPGGEQPRGYAELGRWLARAIPARPDSLREIEKTGRGIGRELADSGTAVDGAPGASGLEDFERAVTWLGFAPRTEPSDSGEVAEPAEPSDEERLTLRLANCPYRQAVEENQPVICMLHKGILSGLLETLEPDAEMTGFHPRDPRTAGCTVDLLLKGRRPATDAGEDAA